MGTVCSRSGKQERQNVQQVQSRTRDISTTANPLGQQQQQQRGSFNTTATEQWDDSKAPRRAARDITLAQRREKNNTATNAQGQKQQRKPRCLRPATLPGPDGDNVPVPDSYSAIQFNDSGSMPVIAAPMLVRIDGGDSSLSSGTDSCGRIRPLDLTKYALVHIPNAVYPPSSRQQSEYGVGGSSQQTSYASRPSIPSAHETFVPLSMPDFEKFKADCQKAENEELI